MKHTITLIFLIMSALPLSAQEVSVDAGLPPLIFGFTDLAKKQYRNQLEIMGMQTTGHVWLKEELDEVTEYQRQFDAYLKTFRDILGYAAQIYGFYHEISRMSANIRRFTDQISDTPGNAIAVALHNRRNDIIMDIVNESVGIINNISQVCLDKKMTGKDRIELVFAIRPRLQKINSRLAILVKLIRTTTLSQVWHEIEYGSLPHRSGKAGIIEESMNRWKTNSRTNIH